MMLKFTFTLMFCLIVSQTCASEPVVVDLWPGQPPEETKELPPEADQTKPEDKLIAGRRIIKLGNVSTPRIAVFRPEKPNGTAVVICPGGGHHILAYDLEGTEVADWLNELGVTGIVLKYRVPFRHPDQKWKSAVQDAQRAMSIVRSRAEDWGIDKNRIGILGFSAGGETAALTSIFLDNRQYDQVDETDDVSSRPDFAMLIYPGRLVQKDTASLQSYLQITDRVPPMFFVHAFDDRVSVHSTLALAGALKDSGVPAEVHVYESGGHGYGLRKTDAPVTQWPDRAVDWMKQRKLVP